MNTAPCGIIDTIASMWIPCCLPSGGEIQNQSLWSYFIYTSKYYLPDLFCSYKILTTIHRYKMHPLRHLLHTSWHFMLCTRPCSCLHFMANLILVCVLSINEALFSIYYRHQQDTE
jgi:hypothetical protein